MNRPILNKRNFLSLLFALIVLILVFEILRDAKRAGDFVGYINAGNATLNGSDIYNDPLNTWPPFFSVFSVPLSIMDGWSPYLVRILWLLGMLGAFYGAMRLSADIFFKRKFSLLKGELTMYHAVILIPFLILFRYLLDNLSNLQINIHMLWMSLLTIHLFIKGKYKWAAFWLALSISLKVYTIFLLLYFIFKRAHKLVVWTLVFLVVFNAIPFMVFGIDGAIEYYHYWVSEIASLPSISHHRNQSIFGAMMRLLTTDSTAWSFRVNVTTLPPIEVKQWTYMLLAIVGIIPAYFFRKPIKKRNSTKMLLEYAFILTSIPILSPISWKAYFIFLWVPTMVIFGIIYFSHHGLKPRSLKLMKWLFWISVALTVFSTRGLLGKHISYVFEIYSCITMGVVLLLIILLILHRNVKKISLF